MDGYFLSAIPEDDVIDISMILNDEFIIRNISNNTTTEILNTPRGKYPVPRRRTDPLTRVTYTAQNFCATEDFELFYRLNYGKSVKMNFEGKIYYGYISDVVYEDKDITFVFTYTSAVPEIPEDRLFTR